MGNKEERENWKVTEKAKTLYTEMNSQKEILQLTKEIVENLLNNEYDKVNKKAEEIYKLKYYKLRHTEVKRVFSEGEIRKILLSKDNAEKILRNLNIVLEKLDKIQKKLKKWQLFSTIVNYLFRKASRASKLREENRSSLEKLGLNTAELYRKEFVKIKQEMNGLIHLLSPVIEMAPPGISDILKLNFETFQKADKICDIVNTYTENILRETQHVGKFQESMNNKNTYISLRNEMFAELEASGKR